MKNKSDSALPLILIFLLTLISCSTDQNNEKPIIKAELPENFKVVQNLGTSFSVCEFRELQHTDGEFIVEGFIGGRKNPFVENRAIFILGDESLETCDEKDDDNCPTPWDVCCEDRNKIKSSTISVQVLDANGSIIKGTLDGVSGIKSGKSVKVKGTLDRTSTHDFIILNAQAIQLL